MDPILESLETRIEGFSTCEVVTLTLLKIP